MRKPDMPKFWDKDFEDGCGTDWTAMYDLCNAELTAQQSKRDQITAFYIAVAGFIVPTVFGMQIPFYAQACGFLLLFIIGWFLSKVVVRYRVYKEVYWITCRTIGVLFSAKPTSVDKRFIQDVFKANLIKGGKQVLKLKDGWEEEKTLHTAIDWRAQRKKVINSAETMIYIVMMLLTALTGFLAVETALIPLFSMIPALEGVLAVCIATAISFAFVVLIVFALFRAYIVALVEVYTYCVTGENKDFNSAYAKAWYLHNYVKTEEDKQRAKERQQAMQSQQTEKIQ